MIVLVIVIFMIVLTLLLKCTVTWLYFYCSKTAISYKKLPYSYLITSKLCSELALQRKILFYSSKRNRFSWLLYPFQSSGAWNKFPIYLQSGTVVLYCLMESWRQT